MTPAINPVAATVISTDSEGLAAGDVIIPTSAGNLPGYRAKPLGKGPFPLVLVVQEIFGVHEHIRDVTRRLAKRGYLAVAPELYFRQGDVSRLADIQEIRSIVATVPDAQVLADLDATVEWARRAGDADVAKLGVTGFCWGGRITWLYAAHNPAVKAAIAWYGRLDGERSALQPRHPIDVVGEIKVPVLGLYGGADPGIPVADVDAVRAANLRARAPAEIVVYPEAPHAFYADYRPSFRSAPAKDGWNRLLAWLTNHGVA